MKINKYRYFTVIAVSALACLCSAAQANTLYQIVGPDGRITLTDRPPTNSTQVTEIGTSAGRGSQADNSHNRVNLNLLPPQVRTAWNAFPITLYTTNDCSGCNTAKGYLQGRGVPFVEYTVITGQDIEAYKSNVAPSASFPSIRVGNRLVTGFNINEWQSYLDAAGYPQENALPNSYRNPSAQPLTNPVEQNTVNTPAQPVTITPIDPPERDKPDDLRTPNNPAGIRF